MFQGLFFFGRCGLRKKMGVRGIKKGEQSYAPICTDTIFQMMSSAKWHFLDKCQIWNDYFHSLSENVGLHPRLTPVFYQHFFALEFVIKIQLTLIPLQILCQQMLPTDFREIQFFLLFYLTVSNFCEHLSCPRQPLYKENRQS